MPDVGILKLVVVPKQKVAAIDNTARREITFRPRETGAELDVIPGKEVQAIDRCVQVGVTQEVRVA